MDMDETRMRSLVWTISGLVRLSQNIGAGTGSQIVQAAMITASWPNFGQLVCFPLTEY